MPHPESAPPHPAPLDEPTARALLERARAARAHAYVPYSRFPVGAALLTEDGVTTVVGCNVENASYGLTNCAERTAVFTAVAAGHRRFRAVAVVGPQDDAPCAPCGACRQVLLEFAPEAVLVTPGGGGTLHRTTVAALLPGAFTGRELPAREGGR